MNRNLHASLVALSVATGLAFAASAGAAEQRHPMTHPMMGHQNTMMGGGAGMGMAMKPPAGFVKVSDALKNKAMAYVPGLGTLWVNPSTLPAGPFLDYSKGGKLMGITFMVPLKEMNAHKDWIDLASNILPHVHVNHVDLDYSPAHPGVGEPHYHVNLWLVSHAEQIKELGVYGSH
jgi:hypothetical protein